MFTREGDAGIHRHIQRRGSGPGVQHDKRVKPQCRPVHRGRPAHTQRMVQLPKVHSRTVQPTERSPRAENPRMLRAEVLETVLYGCVTWSSRACHYNTLRRARHRFLTCRIRWQKHKRADHPISYLDKLIKTGSESIEATLRRRRILFAGFVARMEDTRLPKCTMFGEMVRGAGCVGGQEKEWTGCFLNDLESASTNFGAGITNLRSFVFPRFLF